MGMMTLDIEGWCKRGAGVRPAPVHNIHINVTEECHLMLEHAEAELLETGGTEKLLDVEPEELELEVSPDCGPLSKCQLRVYLNEGDERCHFHLVGNRQSDSALVYSNAVLVDVLM